MNTHEGTAGMLSDGILGGAGSGSGALSSRAERLLRLLHISSAMVEMETRRRGWQSVRPLVYTTRMSSMDESRHMKVLCVTPSGKPPRRSLRAFPAERG